MKRTALFLLVALFLLAACGQSPVSTPQATETIATEPTVIEPTATQAVQGVSLTYEDNAQVELVTPAGRHIYLDVVNPSLFSKQPTADDILLTTHLHNDHYYRDFADAFPGQQILASTGKIELPDVTITGIASGHNAGDPLLDKGGTNYIYIIDIDGLRIAHFGDIGQDALTSDQLAALGPIDIAIMQFNNSFSNMNAANMKGLNLMDQVKPRLIIPTAHVSMPTIQIAVSRWTGYFAESHTVTITPDNIPAGTSILILGNMAAVYNTLYHLKAWK